MLKAIKRLLGITAEQPAERLAERWPDEKLQEVKEYLESIPKDEWEREDHYLLTEWLVRRYLPTDSNITESKFASSMAVLKSRIDANIERLERGEPPPPRTPIPKREPVEDDPEFAAWLKEHLSGHRHS